MKVYGWREQLCESACSIDCADIDREDIAYIDDNKEVHIKGIGNDFCLEGCSCNWFSSFSAAKKFAVKYLQTGIQWRKDAIKEIKNTRKMCFTK